MTTSNGRSTEPRRSGRSVGQWLLGLLIVLAIVASVLMVFTDQLSVAGSLAVIAALWAAVIGAILVTKFRRQAEGAEAKSRDLRLVYELQLEREIAARRQYELDVETTIRKELSAESNEELADLKAQVLALRSSLETLLGESLPDPRAALPSEKLRELASGIDAGQSRSGFGGSSYGSGYGQSFRTDDSALAARDFAATAPAADAGRHIPQDVDPNEMTEVIPVISDDAPMSGRIATEVPETPIDDQVEDAVIAEAEEPSATSPAAPGPSGVGPARGARSPYVDETPTDEWAKSAPEPVVPGSGVAAGVPGAGVPEQAMPETVVSETVAEEVPADAVSSSAAVTPEPDAADAPAPVVEPVVEAAPDAAAEPAVAGPPFPSSGRHESSGESANASVAGRRRRRADGDGESAHSAGLPVSELLSQLRQSGSSGGGRRRRED
ncbi:hypothetical protein QSJ19_06680 [Gordonia sp. ABSL11-1]|uniref:DUF6779 domain-containing protein n=1 Tax=Gordonia sp. ABSL11-1 TaxID=3053924 RepID=UPI0025725346|nr:DUF6779 domain-containing protein [Gordonia sp. ABSL11-1]MDL9945281.1 hypothetical protein [Gordonia sp. ABSL11-1]